MHHHLALVRPLTAAAAAVGIATVLILRHKERSAGVKRSRDETSREEKKSTGCTGFHKRRRRRKGRTPKIAPTALFAALKPRFRKFIASRFTVTVTVTAGVCVSRTPSHPGEVEAAGLDL